MGPEIREGPRNLQEVLGITIEGETTTDIGRKIELRKKDQI